MSKGCKIFSLVMLVCLILAGTMALAETTSGTYNSGVLWSLDDNGVLTISGNGSMQFVDPHPWTAENVKKVVIQDGIKNVGAWAFHSCRNLTSVTIPSSITSIGDSAFSGCRSLTDITIPDSVTSIGDSAFYYCTKLTDIRIPDSVTSIGESAFGYCSSLTNVTLPVNVTDITGGTFFVCTSLKQITLPENVKSIGYNAFYGCEALTNVTIPAGVTSIGNRAFYDCDSLTGFEIPDALTSIGTEVFSSFMTSSRTQLYANPGTDGADTIRKAGYAYWETGADYALKYQYENEIITSITLTAVNENVISLTIPDGITAIYSDAFKKCKKLESVTIPDSMKSIGDKIFSGCSSLKSVTIPSSVTSIGAGAFSGCSNLKSVTFLGSVTSIGTEAFSGCSSLTSIALPEGMTYINSYAFNRCSALSSITLPDSLTGLGAYVFEECSNLESVTLPDGILNVGSGGLSSSSNSPVCYTNMGTETAAALSKAEVPFRIPNGKYDLKYMFQDQEITGLDLVKADRDIVSLVIPDGVTSIHGFAFNYCKNLKSIIIPNSVTIIDYNAFSDCNSLESVTLSEGLVTIGSTVFQNCTALREITIPSSVTIIGAQAFFGCTNLVDLTLPDSDIFIASNAFSTCTSLSDVVLSDKITRIGQMPFPSYTENLKIYASIGSEVAKLLSKQNYRFRIQGGACNLRYVYSGEEITGLEVYSADKDAASLVIPDGVTSIRNQAFYNYGNLTSVEIPDSVTCIGNQAFYNCSNLTSVEIPDSVTEIGDQAFHNCSKLSNTVIPNSVTSIGNVAFYGCKAEALSTECDSYAANYFLGEKMNVSLIHEWEEVTYEWAQDYSKVVAARHCLRNSAHAETESALTTSVTTATCEEEGETTYTTNQFKNSAFDVQSKTVPGTPALGHDWGVPSYVWSEDNKTVTASRVCKRDESHTESETADAASQIKTAAACETDGETEYRASFENEAFSEQTKVLTDIPALGHTPVIDEAVESTCTNTGLTQGSHCSVCGKVLVQQQVTAKKTHTLHYNPSKQATDTAPGVKAYWSCSVCGKLFSDQNGRNEISQPVIINPKVWGIRKTTTGIVITKYYGSENPCTIPDSLEGLPVEEISSYAFTDTGVSSVFIPDTVKTIGGNAFPGNTQIFCHEYSEADFWAEDHGKNRIYVDDTENGNFYQLSLPTQKTLEINDGFDLSGIYWPKLGNEKISLTSEDPDVVEVDEINLKITAMAVGETTVTMKVGGVSRSARVKVHADPADFSITYNNSTEIWLISKKTKQLSVSGVKPAGAEMTLTWSSGNTSIATVTNDGLVEGRRPGTVTISAVAQNGLKKECQVTVYTSCPTHDIIRYPEIPVTCTEAGRTEGSMCSICEEILSGLQEIPALGHDYQLITEVPAGEGTKGVRTYECTRCGEHYTEEDEALPYGSVLIGKRWKIVGVSQGSRNIPKESWGDFGDMYLIFGDSIVEYKLVNKYGNLKFGLTNWYAKEDGSVYIPEINDMYNVSSESVTFIIGDDGLFTMLLWCPKLHSATFRPLDPYTYAPIDLQKDAMEYYGTWTADHLYLNDRQQRFPIKYWPEFASLKMIVREDGTLTFMGEQANWTYIGGNFYINGQKANLHVNTLGQLVWQIDDDASLILVKNGIGALPKLKSLSLPKGLITVEEDAFSGISAEEVIIPQGCSAIEHHAFSNNKALKYVVIPSSMTRIESDAFSGTDVMLFVPAGSKWVQWAEDLGIDVLEY